MDGVENAESREVLARLLTSPLIRSIVGRAHDGDLGDQDPTRRAAAWAHWLLNSLVEVTSGGEGYKFTRTYPAIALPARFYDPKGTGPLVRPHLEIPSRILNHEDPFFADRLAQAGSGLLFPHWLYTEVTAVKRALFTTGEGSVEEVLDLLTSRQGSLRSGLEVVTARASLQWSSVERLLVNSPEVLTPEATNDFSVEEVAAYLPAAAQLQLSVAYDEKLREKNGVAASRRVGVWQLRGVDQDGKRFSLGVITPRLTRESQFNDRLFATTRESPAAMLIRALVLRRLFDAHLTGTPGDFTVSDPTQAAKGGPHLMAIVARLGNKIPDASPESATHFLQCYPDPDAAWAALNSWAGSAYLLTVTEESFRVAHRTALRAIKRAENPEPEDIGCILPLAWRVHDGTVVRVTFSRPEKDA